MNRRGLSARAALTWFLVGVAVGSIAQWTQLRDADHDLTFILRVGHDSGARQFISEELGTLAMTEGLGHDGQYYYLIARDPLATDGLAELADFEGYRFRRPLLGWLAALFGFAGPRAILWGLTFWSVTGLGLATAALADLAALLGGRAWATAGVLGNLGLWLSVQLATPDTLALGLALGAVGLVLRERYGWAAAVLAASVLAKDAYLLFALGLAGWLWHQDQRRESLMVAVVPIAPLILWSLWLSLHVSSAFSAEGSFAIPFVGLVTAATRWSEVSDAVQAGAALVALAVSILSVALARVNLLTWLTLPWVGVALASSVLVWGDGNNAIRAFAPLWALGMLGLAVAAARRTRKAVTAPT